MSVRVVPSRVCRLEGGAQGSGCLVLSGMSAQVYGMRKQEDMKALKDFLAMNNVEL